MAGCECILSNYIPLRYFVYIDGKIQILQILEYQSYVKKAFSIEIQVKVCVYFYNLHCDHLHFFIKKKGFTQDYWSNISKNITMARF